MQEAMISFRGTVAPPWVLAALRSGEVAAVCLFAYNVVSPAQLRMLAESLHAAARDGGQRTPIIGIDQEGGQLMAVTGGATELPGNMALGAAGRPDLAERAGRVLGLELLAMGCTMDFAPVVDLAHHPDNPVVGLRSFGDDPARAGELAAATIRGLQSAGVIATAKHFPGHGATGTDSHHATPCIERDRTELLEVELAPFRAAIAAGVGAIMTAHATYPALDDVPATLSRRVLIDLLRGELGYGGLIVSDAMDMGAMAHLGPAERCAAALAAGNDLVLLGHLEGQQGLVRRLAERGAPDSRGRIESARTKAGSVAADSRGRIESARGALPRELLPLALVGCREHRALAQEIADAAVTVAAGDLTPADISSGTTVRLAAQVAARHRQVLALTMPYRSDLSAVAAVLSAVADADHLIVATVDVAHDPAQEELLQALRTRGQTFVHVALRTPYDLAAAPFAAASLCGYGVREANTESVVRALFGEIEPRGSLPCALPRVGRGGRLPAVGAPSP